MSQENAQVMLDIFSAIEHRDPQRPDPQRLLALCHPDIEFHWPPSRRDVLVLAVVREG
jgi:hypothetical protein